MIGGGIIGLSLSIELRKRGAAVLVVERGEIGHEASRAAGGMLVDSSLETPKALQALATASASLYPEFAYELEVESGMKVDLRDRGTILFVSEEHFDQAKDLPDAKISDLEPALVHAVNAGKAVYLKERSVDPRGLTAADCAGSKEPRCAIFRPADPVTAVDLSDGAVIRCHHDEDTLLGSQNRQLCGRMVWTDRSSPVPHPARERPDALSRDAFTESLASM